MAKLTKKDLVAVVAVENMISKKLAEATIDSTLRLIEGAAIDGDDLTIKNFGKFVRKKLKPRKYTTKMGEVNLPERYAMKFKPSDKFREKLNPAA